MAVKSSSAVFAFYMSICGIGLMIMSFFGNIFGETQRSFNFFAVDCFYGGAFTLISGLLLCMVALKERNNLRRLKLIGTQYDAVIDRVKRSPSIGKANRKISIIAYCSYFDRAGKLCHVKSKRFVLDKKIYEICVELKKDNYEALVYVNDGKSSDYAVEIFIKE